MAYSNSVIKANHFLVELLPEARNGFLLAMQKFGPNHKTSRTFTESNISGIESLSITTTYENIVLRNNFSPEWICDLNNEFELIISGKYSNYMVNLPFTIINKKEQWSLCCKINFTLHLSQLLDKGLYVVVNIPLYGIQAVINYNCFTKDVTVTYRLAVLDGTLEDKNKASSDGCKLVCLNVDIIKNKIDKRIFEPIDVTRAVPCCNVVMPRANDVLMPRSVLLWNSDIPPPLPPREESLNQQPTLPNTIQNRSVYGNTPNPSPPSIPQRPNTNWSRSYSAQGGYSTQFSFGTQKNTSTQSSTSINQYSAVPPRIAPKPQTFQNTPQPPPYSYSAPNTPTIQPQTTSTGTKTEPVRKGAEQFSVTVNKACNGIDRFMTKASNALSPSKKANQNNQQQQIAPVIKTY
jgi:hypothetical protein